MYNNLLAIPTSFGDTLIKGFSSHKISRNNSNIFFSEKSSEGSHLNSQGSSNKSHQHNENLMAIDSSFKDRNQFNTDISTANSSSREILGDILNMKRRREQGQLKKCQGNLHYDKNNISEGYENRVYTTKGKAENIQQQKQQSITIENIKMKENIKRESQQFRELYIQSAMENENLQRELRISKEENYQLRFRVQLLFKNDSNPQQESDLNLQQENKILKKDLEECLSLLEQTRKNTELMQSEVNKKIEQMQRKSEEEQRKKEMEMKKQIEEQSKVISTYQIQMEDQRYQLQKLNKELEMQSSSLIKERERFMKEQYQFQASLMEEFKNKKKLDMEEFQSERIKELNEREKKILNKEEVLAEREKKMAKDCKKKKKKQATQNESNSQLVQEINEDNSKSQNSKEQIHVFDDYLQMLMVQATSMEHLLQKTLY